MFWYYATCINCVTLIQIDQVIQTPDDACIHQWTWSWIVNYWTSGNPKLSIFIVHMQRLAIVWLHSIIIFTLSLKCMNGYFVNRGSMWSLWFVEYHHNNILYHYVHTFFSPKYRTYVLIISPATLIFITITFHHSGNYHTGVQYCYLSPSQIWQHIAFYMTMIEWGINQTFKSNHGRHPMSRRSIVIIFEKLVLTHWGQVNALDQQQLK